MAKHGISQSVGRENDLRWKLSPDDIAEIKRLRSSGMIVRQIATIYGINVGTVNYWCNDRLRAYMRAKNAKRKRNSQEEKLQYANKERRRSLTREAVRVYNKLNNRVYRKADPEHARSLARKSQRKFRKDKPERAKALHVAYWHRHHCKCLQFGTKHNYGRGIKYKKVIA